MTNHATEPKVNPVTGEIMDDDTDQPLTGTLLPAVRTETTDVALAYGSLEELIAAYQEPEPDPRQVALWLLGAEEKEDDDAEESQLSIMLRILGAEGVDQILASQEVMGADELLREVLILNGVKWKKSTKGDGKGVYALMMAHRETTDTDVVISCGGKNVCAQLLRLNAGGYLPHKVMVTKSAKPTAAGFYPLWLEPA